MKGKGIFSSGSDRRLRMMLGAHIFWLAMVCLLGAWWGRLVLSQASRIAELEGALGWARDITQDHRYRTQRMLYWESATFFGLLLASTLLLFWLYWRDLKRSRGLQSFFASVTHELRTPLTSIRLQAESIAEKFNGSPAQAQWIRRLLEDTLRLESQVERTLELSRIEGGGPVMVQSLPIKPWLDRFLRAWQRDYQDRVRIDCKVGDLLVHADPAALHVIFRNLLENSLRHSNRETTSIEISAVQGSARISVLLQDNGEGYPGDQKKLGELFQKGKASQGTGVGLYLVKSLMNRMGGDVRFSSNSGFGVSLCFREGQNG